MNTTSFPTGTRFFSRGDSAIVIIGGPLSGGAPVKFTGHQIVEISDDDFFKIVPDKISEAKFREKVGQDVLARWFASEPNPITTFLAMMEDSSVRGALARHGIEDSDMVGVPDSELKELLDMLVSAKAKAGSFVEDGWISSDDMKEDDEKTARRLGR